MSKATTRWVWVQSAALTASTLVRRVSWAATLWTASSCADQVMGRGPRRVATVPTSRRAWTRAMARSSSLKGSLRWRSRTSRPPRSSGSGRCVTVPDRLGAAAVSQRRSRPPVGAAS